MNIAKRVEKYLRAEGYVTKVFSYDGLSEIVDEANDWGADVFVSIHCNAANGSACGTETYTTGSSEGTKLANAIQAQLLKKVPQTIDRGVKTRGFYVIRYADAPAVLVETAFIDNSFDAQLLVNHEDDFAKAIAEGITDYTGFKAKPLPDVIDVPVDNENNIEKIAALARKYESNGDPACVANNFGDLGGISYGLYQFASRVGTVDAFLNGLKIILTQHSLTTGTCYTRIKLIQKHLFSNGKNSARLTLLILEDCKTNLSRLSITILQSKD